MAKKCFLVIAFSFLAFACSSSSNNDPSPPSNPTASDDPQSLDAPTLARSDFMTGLQNPWDLAFLSDGTLFYTEKCLGLSVQRPDGSRTRLFGTTGSSLVANDFFCSGQSGMNGVAIDPQFSNNRFIFVFMASNLNSGNPTNRVIRLRVNDNFTSASERTDIVTDIPFKANANNWGSPGAHSGGRIRFGPDSFLYVTTGDNHNGPLPQDLQRLGGKILRIDRNGTAAPGNNSLSGADPRIYTYGHRNVQGIDFRPATGRVFVAEHGPGHSDEITALSAGGNGGWDPVPDPGVSCADNYCGYISNKLDGTLTPMTDTAKFPDALQPIYKVNDSAGMGPCAFLSGPQWKAWSGALTVGIMASQKLNVIQLRSESEVERVTTASLPDARIRSLVQGPDGNLYIATDQGSVWKVTPQ